MESTIDQILLMQDTIIVTLCVAGTQGLTISFARSIQCYLFFCSQRNNFRQTDEW